MITIHVFAQRVTSEVTRSYNWWKYVNPTNIGVINRSGDSVNILSKPIKILITYEE